MIFSSLWKHQSENSHLRGSYLKFSQFATTITWLLKREFTEKPAPNIFPFPVQKRKEWQFIISILIQNPAHSPAAPYDNEGAFYAIESIGSTRTCVVYHYYPTYTHLPHFYTPQRQQDIEQTR